MKTTESTARRAYPALTPSQRLTAEQRRAASAARDAREREAEQAREIARATFDPETIRLQRRADADAARAKTRRLAESDHKTATSLHPVERLMHNVVRAALRDARANRPYAQVVYPHAALLADDLIDRQQYDQAEWWAAQYSIAHGQPQRAGLLRVDFVGSDTAERESCRQLALDNLLAAEVALSPRVTQLLRYALVDGYDWQRIGRLDGCSDKTAKARVIRAIEALDTWRESRASRRRDPATIAHEREAA